ncbi:MAG: hypothetical protein AAGG75_17520 [Bacteroidota bacterium]
MSDQQQPLDYEELEAPIDVRGDRLRRLAFYLEWIPILLIGLGIYLKSTHVTGGGIFIVIGGLVSGLIYLCFSWFLFKVEEYVFIEVLLSILTGLVFATLVVGIVYKMQMWNNANEMIYLSMMSGLGLCFVSFVLYVFQITNARASRFYRKLLSRLLIFVVIAYSISVEL